MTQREKRLDEMRDDFQTTDSQLQTCMASVVYEAEQLQQIDQQLSAAGTNGTVVVLHLLYVLIEERCSNGV